MLLIAEVLLQFYVACQSKCNVLDDHSGGDERQNSEENDEHEDSSADWGTDIELVVDAVASESSLDQFTSVASTALSYDMSIVHGKCSSLGTYGTQQATRIARADAKGDFLVKGLTEVSANRALALRMSKVIIRSLDEFTSQV